MSELRQFKLPDVGEGLTEAEIVKWHVQPGDKVGINQIIVEIETAKAVVELPSPYEGVVDKLLVPEGVAVEVGTPIISVHSGEADQAGEPTAATAASRPAEVSGPIAEISAPPAEGAVEPGIHGSPAPKEERQAVLVGYGVKLGATKRRARKPAGPGPANTARASAGAGAAAGGAATGGDAAAGGAGKASGGATAVLAKPPVRKLAKDLGVDLATLSGSGRPARSRGTTSRPRPGRRELVPRPRPRSRPDPARPPRSDSPHCRARSGSRFAACASTRRRL